MIRQATLQDAAAIADVHIACWREAYSGTIPESYLNRLDVRQRAAAWSKTLEQGKQVWVAQEHGKIVGFANGGPNRNEEQAVFPGELYAIYLLAAHQKQGIGCALFEQVRGQLRKDGLLPFVVWGLADNPACGFYERMGGRVIGETFIDFDGLSLRELQYGLE